MIDDPRYFTNVSIPESNEIDSRINQFLFEWDVAWIDSSMSI